MFLKKSTWGKTMSQRRRGFLWDIWRLKMESIVEMLLLSTFHGSWRWMTCDIYTVYVKYPRDGLRGIGNCQSFIGQANESEGSLPVPKWLPKPMLLAHVDHVTARPTVRSSSMPLSWRLIAKSRMPGKNVRFVQFVGEWSRFKGISSVPPNFSSVTDHFCGWEDHAWNLAPKY